MNKRFDMDRAVDMWRRGMEQRRTFSTEDLDELESHLIEYIDDLIGSGLSGEQAFHRASQALSKGDDVEDEFRKTRWRRAALRGRLGRDSVQEFAMVANYARIGLRNLRRQASYTLINVGGLALGIATCLMILLFVVHEFSYDRHHPEADRTFRVTRAWFEGLDGGKDGAEPVMEMVRISIPIGPAMEAELPEVETSVRLWQLNAPIEYGDDKLDVAEVFFTDSSYFEVFGPALIEGDIRTVLTRPDAIVLSEEMAVKYFGESPALGQILTLYGDFDFEVTGVMGKVPPNSHFHPDLVASIGISDQWLGELERTHWGMYNNYATYVVLTPEADVAALSDKLDTFLRSHYTPENNTRDVLSLQALTDIHLRSNLNAELEPNGSLQTVYLFLAIALFVLLIACFNFINLATARTSHRSREVGIRKVLGARPGQVFRQFLGESTTMAFIATLVAVGLVAAILPAFSEFTGRDVRLAIGSPVGVAAVLSSFVLVIGLFAGGYPALFLSRFRPAEVLRGGISGRWRSRLRSTLVVAQFAISIVLICGMGLVFRQVEYARTKQLGFEKERLVVLPATQEMRSDFDAVRRRLLMSRLVEDVTASNLIPSGSLVDHIGVDAEVNGEIKSVSMPLNPVDHHFVDTYGMEIIAGRTFSEELASDSTGGFVINEAAVELLGWDSPEESVGKRFDLVGNSLVRSGQVIGVVRDFHFESIREKISPLVLFIMPERYRTVTVRLAAGDPGPALDYLEEHWAQFRPGLPFSYSFIDDNFGALYENERRLGEMFGVFAGLAILIACLGLFGLASFVTERRSKEIGVRKALGASVATILATLSKDFLVLVGFAFLLAGPITWFLIDRWLSSFAYRVGFGVDWFVLSGVLVAAFALATVAFQSVKSALADPVVSLRDE